MYCTIKWNIFVLTIHPWVDLNRAVGKTSTSWWRNHTSDTWLDPRFLSPKLLSKMAYLLARFRLEYSWVILVSTRASDDWIKRFGNSSSASTKICQNRHLFPGTVVGNVDLLTSLELRIICRQKSSLDSGQLSFPYNKKKKKKKRRLRRSIRHIWRN